MDSGQRSQDQKSEAEGFGGADAGGDGGAELRGVSDGEFALELDGSVGAVRGAVLVEEFSATGDGAKRVGVEGEATGCRLALEPGDQVLTLSDWYTAAVFLARAVGVVHPELLGGIGQQAEAVACMGEEVVRDDLGAEAIGRAPVRLGASAST